MSATNRSAVRRGALGAGLVLALVVAGAWWLVQSRARTGLPDPDLSAMEAPVARLLKQAREEVLDEPRSAAKWGSLGGAYHAHRLIDEAIACYERARELDPADFRWAYLLAIAREVAGAEADELLAGFRTAAELRPDYAPVHARLGVALASRGRLDEAGQAYLRAVELDPELALAHRGLGQIRLEAGDTETALHHLTRAVTLSPDDAAAYSSLAQASLRMGRPDLAEEASRRASRLEPVGAIRDPVFEEEVASRSSGSTRVLERAVKAIRVERHSQALSDLALVLESRPDDPEVHYWLGVAYRKTGDDAAALRHLERSLELDARHPAARLGYASLLDTAGRFAEAAGHYALAAELEPDDPTIRLRLGLALLRAGNYVDALEPLEEGVRLRPEDPDARFLLARTLAELGVRSRAIEQLEKAVELDPEHRAGELLEDLRSRQP